MAKRRSDPMERGLFGKDTAPAESMIPGAHFKFKKDETEAVPADPGLPLVATGNRLTDLKDVIRRAIKFIEAEQFETAKSVLLGAIES